MGTTNPATTEPYAINSTRSIANAIRDLRGSMSAQKLSDITAELGCRVTRAVIADLETGRRKFLPVHEVLMLAAALGVSPAVLLTWDAYPDGTVELLPGRAVTAFTAAEWIGGHGLPRAHPLATTLPPRNEPIAELWDASRERANVSALTVDNLRALHGGTAAVVGMLSDRLEALTARIAVLQAQIAGEKAA